MQGALRMRWSVLTGCSLIFVLWSSLANAAITVVQQAHAIDAGASTISATITGTTSGNGLVVTVTGTGGSAIGSISISGETVSCGTEQVQTAFNTRSNICYVKNLSSGGSKTATNATVLSNWGVQIIEITGQDTTTFTDGQNGSVTSSGNVSYSLSVTAGSSGDAIFFNFCPDNGTPTTPTGYTAGTNNNEGSRCNNVFYKLSGSSGSNSATSTTGSPSNWAGNGQAILASGAPPPTTGVRHRRVQ